ncbi:MAG: hypothetical protein RLZZ292_1147 [Bacteroidota bacterium]|jgi:hypothetical protein
MRKHFILTTLLLTLSFSIWAQLPTSNIYLFDVSKHPSGRVILSKPKFLTRFNPTGYNNQPYFMNDDELYLTVQFPWDTTQTDIYSLSLKDNTFLQVTNTKESEYSPKKVPGTPNFSVVRVDATPKKTQRLWEYPLNRSNQGVETFKNIQNVGYYNWITGSNVALFLVGENKAPNAMVLATVSTENTVSYPKPPGRTFQTLPNGQIAYVSKETDDDWFIRLLNPRDYSSVQLAPAHQNSEDFVILADGTILMGRGSKLYQFRPKIDENWVEATDLRRLGIKKIERLTVNNRNQLAMVVK